MKLSKIIGVLLCLLCIVLCLGSCSEKKNPPATTTPPITTPEAPIEMVDVITGGASAYRLIQPARSAMNGVSSLAFEIYTLAGRLGVSMPIQTDKTDPTALEILVGNTNRAASETIMARLAETANEDSFYYLVAELDGMVVLYATDPVAYDFLTDYFIATYVTNEGLRIPKGLYDLHSMTWTAYAEYLAELERLEQERLEAERQAQVASLKSQIQSFDASSFGTLPAVISSSYSAPLYTPEKGEHPRIWITEETIPTVKANLSAPENEAAYEYIL